MSQPTIITPEGGFHNRDLQRAQDRLIRGNTYKDLSTVCVVPTRGVISARVIQSWFSLMTPMNQRFTRIFMSGMEVGEAYSQAIEFILASPELSKWKYVLTLEEDNMPPPDGLLKLVEAIEGKVDGQRYDVVGGLYWTKGEGGQPMIYGDPDVLPINFIPQLPRIEGVQRTNGLGMGFNLFRLEMFRDPKLERPLFKSQQEYMPGVGMRAYSQDLYFYERAGALGYRFACDTRVKVGHYDYENDFVW
jgi:hypothetical protein